MSPDEAGDGCTSQANIIKCRDDSEPVFIKRRSAPASDSKEPQFELSSDSTASWAKADEFFGPERLRPRIEPWLTALCQSEHLSILLGTGLCHAVHRLGTGQALPSGMSPVDFDEVVTVEATRSAMAAGRGPGNIEDQLRAANELLRGLEILGARSSAEQAKANALREDLKAHLADFAAALLSGERSLILAEPEQREEAFNYLVSFLMSFASRSGTRERLHIFTTNYDRFIEAGADVAGLHLLDRFVGSLAPIFRSSRLDIDMHYNPPGIRGEPRYLEGVARFTKLHGSVDWIDCDRNIRKACIPFGAESVTPYLEAPGMQGATPMGLMVYPNASKDRETASYPYVELFRDFAAAVCRPNHALIAYGYSFGDEHLNRIIEDMLTIPSTHLVVISYDDPLNRIMDLYKRLGRHAQVSLLIGDHLGALQDLVDQYLPKPAIDRTTFRMAELLKARWGANPHGGQAPSDSQVGNEGNLE